MGSLASFAALIAVAYAVLVGALFLFQRNLLYYPAASPPTPAASGVPEMREVTVNTDDGLALKSWYAPPSGDRPVVLYFCGNAGHIGYRAFKARTLLDAGYGVLLLSYRGYGGNPGRPTEEGLYADARAAFDFVAEQGLDSKRVALYGESLGTGVAVRLAADLAAEGTPVAAVVLETPYSSIAAVAAHHYPFVPVRWLIKDRFEAIERIGGIDAPLFIFHSEDDRVIPIRFARRLYEAAVEPKKAKWFTRGGHEGGFDEGAGDLVLDFLSRHAGTRENR